MFDVIIIGGGPTGMMLASELRLHDVSVLVLEGCRADPARPVARTARAQHRDPRPARAAGAVPRAGHRPPGRGSFRRHRHAPPDDLDTAHGYVLGIPHPLTDRLLAERADELGTAIRRGAEVVGIEQDEEGVAVALADGTSARGSWAVGCDGGRSFARRTLGVGFPGDAATTEWLLGEIEVTTPADKIAALSQEVRKTHRGFGIGSTPPSICASASVGFCRSSATRIVRIPRLQMTRLPRSR